MLSALTLWWSVYTTSVWIAYAMFVLFYGLMQFLIAASAAGMAAEYEVKFNTNLMLSFKK